MSTCFASHTLKSPLIYEPETHIIDKEIPSFPYLSSDPISLHELWELLNFTVFVFRMEFPAISHDFSQFPAIHLAIGSPLFFGTPCISNM